MVPQATAEVSRLLVHLMGSPKFIEELIAHLPDVPAPKMDGAQAGNQYPTMVAVSLSLKP